MISALYSGMAPCLVRWRQRMSSIDRPLPATIAMVVAGLALVGSGIGYTVTWHARSHAQRIHALQARNEVDTLQAMFLSANADFLEGLGSARVASRAWPVQRVGKTVQCFARLEKSYANDP